MTTPEHAATPIAPRWTFWRSRFGGPASFGESLRIERVIGVTRLLLALLALVEITVTRAEPTPYVPLVYLAFIFFAAHSAAALLVLRYQQQISRSFVVTTTTVDMTVTLITLPVTGPLNAFMAFFLFVLASSAFRWGRRETLAIAAGAALLVLARGYLAQRFPQELPLLMGAADPGHTLGQAGYLVVMGLLLAFLADEARRLRVESASLAALLSGVRFDAGVARAVTAAARNVVALFDASRLMLVLEHRPTERVVRWDTESGWKVGAQQDTSEAGTGRATYFFGPPDVVLAIVRHRGLLRLLSRHRVTAMTQAGRVMARAAVGVPEAFASDHPFRRLAVVPVNVGGEWSGRLFLFEPRVNLRLAAVARFLQVIARQVAPALFNVHLQSQLQERAGALERARVARELHDGVIQSLISVEMQLQVLRHNAAAHPVAPADLARIQDLVHSEVLNLRELMQQMRPIEFDPDELLEYVADLVDRFGRDTGIAARFFTDLKSVRIPWRVCFELVRIVQEGLVNVRKHSGATAVEVRFGVRGGAWQLEISDNGRGFPVDAASGLSELDVARRQPAVIKERVRAIGGDLTVESAPGRGTRLEIRVPQEAHV